MDKIKAQKQDQELWEKKLELWQNSKTPKDFEAHKIEMEYQNQKEDYFKNLQKSMLTTELTETKL